jgi:proteasome lid subunit RPN8/RPN11
MKTLWKIRRNDYKRLLLLSRRKTKRHFGREICGFLIDNGYYLHPWLTKNRRKTPGGFSYYASEVKELEKITKKLGIEIVGTFHSHPVSEAVPSPNDVKYAENDSLMLIFDCVGNEGRLWHIKDRQYRKEKIELI